MADKLVTIAQFTNYIEAEMAKQLLADYGIEAVATGVNAANVYGGLGIAAAELKVLESQAQEALKILQASEEKGQEQ